MTASRYTNSQIDAQVDVFVQQIQHQQAIDFLQYEINSNSSPSTVVYCKTKLINLYVSLSKHRQAKSIADRLESKIRLRLMPLYVHLIVLPFLAVGLALSISPWRLKKILNCIFDRIYNADQTSYELVRSVHFANFWFDIKKCQKLGMLELLKANDDQQLIKALAWLAYSRAYRGGSRSALRILQFAYENSTKIGAKNELEPLWAIALFMNHNYERSLAVIEKFARDNSDASEFYKLLMSSVKITCLSGKGNLDELSKAVDECFSYSISLPKSRHQLQTYGAEAMLMAVSGKPDVAATLLLKAKDAADENDDDLDWLIYWRWVAEVHSYLGESGAALSAVNRMQEFMTSYGKLSYYSLMAEKIRRRAKSGLTADEYKEAYCYITNKKSLVGKTAELPWLHLIEKSLEILFSKQNEASENLSDFISSIFDDSQVITANTYTQIVDEFKQKASISSFATIDESAPELRITCANNTFILALPLSNTNKSDNKSSYFGILLKGVQPSNIDNHFIALRFLMCLFQQRNQIQTLIDEAGEHERVALVAQATQMLAHDVRKPFSQLSNVLTILQSKPDSELRDYIESSVPIVKKSIHAVNGMIYDVLETGRWRKLQTEQLNLESLIHNCLVENLRYEKPCNLTFSYQFAHTKQVLVDGLKVNRILSNILVNAVQAMDKKGRIWFTSRQLSDQIELTIGNSGSYIPVEKREHLFDMFYTDGKVNGTGLGLAITKKLVEEHGGKISCTSNEDQGTEFVITLPCSTSDSTSTTTLPENHEKLLQWYGEIANRVMEEVQPKYDDIDRLASALSTNNRMTPFKILVIDDEIIYQESIERILANTALVNERIELHKCPHPEDALDLAGLLDFDLILMDVDFGVLQPDGFSGYEKIKNIGYKGQICFNSNNTSIEYMQKASELGGLFIPKPISKEHLFKLIAESLLNTNQSQTKLPYVAVIDDCPFFTYKATKDLSDANIETFTSPEDFLQKIKTQNINKFSGIILDNYFDDSSTLGIEFGKVLRNDLNYEGKLYLSSDGYYPAQILSGYFNGTICKSKPGSWQEIQLQSQLTPILSGEVHRNKSRVLGTTKQSSRS